MGRLKAGKDRDSKVLPLAGKADQIKESIVGVEVFGRRPDYDVRQDSAVRTEAGKLRARLLQYYAGEGASDQLVIELPKGGYAPAFRQVERAPGLADPKKRRTGPLWAIMAFACVVVSLAAFSWKATVASGPLTAKESFFWRLENPTPSIPIRLSYALVAFTVNRGSVSEHALRIEVLYASGKLLRLPETFAGVPEAEFFIQRFYPDLIGKCRATSL